MILETRPRVDLPRVVIYGDVIDDVGSQHVSTDEFRCLRLSVRIDRH